MKTIIDIENEGVSLTELVIAVAIIGILALLTAPQINRFVANYNLRSCATDLIQNMRLARAMAIKENRNYLVVFGTANQRFLIGFDGDGDSDLITADSDTFGLCKDADSDRLPEGDTDTNGDGVPECVKVVNLSNCGRNIIFGYSSGTTPPNGPNGAAIPTSGISLSGGAASTVFNPDGSVDATGSIYFQHTGRGYSYSVEIANASGGMNMWKWDGDKDNASETDWTEIR